MSTTYNLKLESEIKNIGFKKKWLDDKSGYWMEYKTKFYGIKLKFIVETDKKLFIMSAQTYNYIAKKMHKGTFEDLAKYNCDFKTIKNIIGIYKQ